MNTYNIGDHIVYVSNINTYEKACKELHNHGIVRGKKYPNYLLIQFNSGSVHDILYYAIHHINKEPKTINKLTINKLTIPNGSYDAITYDKFKNGDIIVDFLRTNDKYESDFNTYYNKISFNKLTHNPFSLKKIDYSTIKNYIVNLI